MHSLRFPRGWQASAKRVFYLFAERFVFCLATSFLLLRLGGWISDVFEPLVSPRGCRPVTQVERHLTGSEIRPGEGAWRADRKEQVGNKAVCVVELYLPAVNADSLLLLLLL